MPGNTTPTTTNTNRIYYAIHSVGISDLGASGSYLEVSGVQSVGLNTTFNLEQVFQLGQLELYDNIENIPDIECTIEKILDGTALLQHLGSPAATSSGLAGRYNNAQSTIAIAYYPDDYDNASGIPDSEVVLSGVYVSTITMTFPVEGNSTESVTFVGNDKQWASGLLDQDANYGSGIFGFIPNRTGATAPTQDSPPNNSPVASGGISRREDVDMDQSIWPVEIPGVLATGKLDTALAAYGAHIQTVTVNVDLGRTELFELGRRGPYHRFAEFPTEVTCAIECIETEYGDFIDAREDPPAGALSSLVNQHIAIHLVDGTLVNLGSKNKLASITSTGGDTGGGNRTVTYNYSNFNFFTTTQGKDPAGQFEV